MNRLSHPAGGIRGFTLLELLVVIVIIGLLAGYVAPRYFSQDGKSEVQVAKAQIESLEKALDLYRLDNRRYPSSEQGLKALTEKPASESSWKGPYLKKAAPLDPWGNAYIYRQPDAAAGKGSELVWIGNQFREAIGLYYQRTPRAAKRFPETLEDPLEDRRFLTRQRYLRRIYTDPFTGKSEWGLIQAPGGGISGVYSLAEGRSIGHPVLGRNSDAIPSGAIYQEWKFMYEPPIPLPDSQRSGTAGKNRRSAHLGRSTQERDTESLG